MPSINYTAKRELVVASVTSITRSGTTATVTESNHGRITGESVTIAGAAQSDYNGSFGITVTGTDTYEYTVSGSPATPATGTITATRTVDQPYDFDFSIASLDRQRSVDVDTYKSIGGRTEAIHKRNEKHFNVEVWLPSADLGRWEEILHSVEGREQFTFDPDGTAASPVNAVSVILDSDDWSFSQVNPGANPYYRVTFRMEDRS